MGTGHPSLEGGSRVIRSEMMSARDVDRSREERLGVHYSQLDALMTTRDPGGAPRKVFQDFSHSSFMVPPVLSRAAWRNEEGDQTQSAGAGKQRVKRIESTLHREMGGSENIPSHPQQRDFLFRSFSRGCSGFLHVFV